jgi:hypothetical protein
MASVSSFGLFWRRDQVIWTRDDIEEEDELESQFKFVLFGKLGHKRPKLKVCDFRFQQGIYILYDEYGPVYLGLSGRRKNGEALGQRLKEHLADRHGETWSRFSWFGFDKIESRDDVFCGISTASSAVIEEGTNVSSTIRDTEALLMHIIMPANNRSSITKFKDAVQWEQVPRYEISSYMGN